MAYSPKKLGSAQRKRAVVMRSLTPYLFLAPALIVLALTVFWPALQAFYLSFTRFEYDLTQPAAWVGFANFQKLWRDPVFWKTLGNTVLYLVCVVPLLVTLSLGLAILVNQNLKGIRWFRTAYYTPVVISMVVAGIAWKWLYASNGLFNQGLQLLGFAEGIPWLTSPDLSLFSVMAVTVWKGLGYYMVIYLAGLQDVPQPLYEAAELDGATWWQKTRNVTIPMLSPVIFFNFIMGIIGSIQVFTVPYVMFPQGSPSRSTYFLTMYLFDNAFIYHKMGYACAMGWIMFVIILALTWLARTVSERHVYYEGG